MPHEPSATSRPHTIQAHGVTLELEPFGVASSTRAALLHLHRDELTALAAARRVVAETGGHGVTISGARERRVEFTLRGVRYSFDPNRAFTPRGRQATLDPNVSPNDDARAVVEAFALGFLALVGPGPIVAVHNNSPGPPLSILSFLPGASDEAVAAEVFVATDHVEDDFALVTTRRLFLGFQRAGFNVVLQSDDAPDDGSLSVYCALRRIPYVNIEALEEHLDEQVRLVRFARDLLARPAE